MILMLFHAATISTNKPSWNGIWAKPRERLRKRHSVGAQLDSASGTLGAPRHKIGALAALLFGIAVRGLTTVVMLEMLTGQLAYVGCFRRPLLVALGLVFCQTSPDGLRETVF